MGHARMATSDGTARQRSRTAHQYSQQTREAQPQERPQRQKTRIGSGLPHGDSGGPSLLDHSMTRGAATANTTMFGICENYGALTHCTCPLLEGSDATDLVGAMASQQMNIRKLNEIREKWTAPKSNNRAGGDRQLSKEPAPENTGFDKPNDWGTESEGA